MLNLSQDERIHGKLKDLGISDQFDWVMTSAETGLEKPRLQGFLRMLKIADIQDEGNLALHIGDSYAEDFEGSKKAGKIESTVSLD